MTDSSNEKHGLLILFSSSDTMAVVRSQAMNPQIIQIANAFHIGAAVLGLPSTVALIFYAIFRLRLWMTPATPASAPMKNPDAILMIILGMAKGFGAIANGIGAAGKVIFGWIASAAILLATCLFFTARGLLDHQTWARGMAALLMIALLLVSVVSLVSAKSRHRLISVLLMAGSIYALRGLWAGYGG